jgi:cGMP-dependent protein kinase
VNISNHINQYKMGAGAASGMNSPRNTQGGSIAGDDKKPARRLQIFAEAVEGGDLKTVLDKKQCDPETQQLLMMALSGFFFLEQDSRDNSKVDMMLSLMEKEELSQGLTIITEGESGSKLYVVESGNMEVLINGEVIREMGRGSLLGELALLYDAPRSATVRCKSDCVVWSLKRDIFKKIQAGASSAAAIQRARWLIASPELAILSAIDQSRLVGCLVNKPLTAGEFIFSEGIASKDIFIIEQGIVKIYTSTDLSSLSISEIDKKLGIVRPKSKRTSVSKMSGSELSQYLDKGEEKGEEYEHKASDESKMDGSFFACDVYAGCIIGISTLKGKAGLPESWTYIAETPDDRTSEGASTGGGIPPFTAQSESSAQVLSFTVEVFERLFGPAVNVFSTNKEKIKGVTLSANLSLEEPEPERTFDSSKFKIMYVLGSGSFGVATMAEYRDGTDPPEKFALKSLSKAAAVETGQLRHVLDERKLLAQMRNRFILKLFGTYQTPHQLVMVTEVLECGDLWSVIYEVPPYPDVDGIPQPLVVFYAASLVLGLSHIHEKGICFRDLKPENVMVDNNGYLRIIDFGFCKIIPYTKTDSQGNVTVCAKSFTLCGTPGNYSNFV